MSPRPPSVGRAAMASSPRSVTFAYRRSDERPVVSGLGLSSSSEGSETMGPALDPAPAVVGDAAPGAPAWVQPPPTRKELWRRRLGLRGSAAHGETSVRPRREVPPEMAGLCFRCFEEGHFRRDCTNDIVCLRCGGSGHSSEDCKRPRSPSPEEELRRQVAARVARNDQAPSRRAPFAGGGSSSLLPPPPPPPMQAAPAAWPRLHLPRLVDARHEEFNLQELCITRCCPSMADLERRLQFAMVAYAAGARHDITLECGDWGGHRDRAGVDFRSQEIRNMVAERPFVEHRGIRLYFRQWNRQAQAVHSAFCFKVSLILEGIPSHTWERGVVIDLLGSSCIVDMVALETSSHRDLSAFKLMA
uniref:CCHC-type domain-containing protein n=1 Tax=Aegilops tauschii subsp. strangulata TaxID=200361 RepID=A0A452Y0P0_AEGTS